MTGCPGSYVFSSEASALSQQIARFLHLPQILRRQPPDSIAGGM